MFVYYLSMILILISLFLVFLAKYNSRKDKHRYMLYAIRDKLVRYTLEGKIQKDSKEFHKLYKLINQIISSVEEYDLIKLMKLITQVEKILKREKFPKFIENKYVEEILLAIAEAIIEIIYDNSLMVRVYTNLKLHIEILKFIFPLKLLMHTPQFQIYKKAKDIYQDDHNFRQFA